MYGKKAHRDFNLGVNSLGLLILNISSNSESLELLISSIVMPSSWYRAIYFFTVFLDIDKYLLTNNLLDPLWCNWSTFLTLLISNKLLAIFIAFMIKARMYGFSNMIKFNLNLGGHFDRFFHLERRVIDVERILAKYMFKTQILKWDTKSWGEIPADFGRNKRFTYVLP